MLNDLDKLNGWPDVVKSLQRNWIGKSTLTYIDFPVYKEEESNDKMIGNIRIATTRPDTI